MLEWGVIFNVDGHHYPATVEEAWTLRDYVQATAADATVALTAAEQIRLILEQRVLEADGMRHATSEYTLQRAELAEIWVALNRWLDDVGFADLPPRMLELRDALFAEDADALNVRDVVFIYDDGHEEHERNVIVTGDRFPHAERWWRPQSWRRLHGIDEVDGELRTWLICREIPAPMAAGADEPND